MGVYAIDDDIYNPAEIVGGPYIAWQGQGVSASPTSLMVFHGVPGRIWRFRILLSMDVLPKTESVALPIPFTSTLIHYPLLV